MFFKITKLPLSWPHQCLLWGRISGTSQNRFREKVQNVDFGPKNVSFNLNEGPIKTFLKKSLLL